MDSQGSLSTNTSSLCGDIIQTGILECYGLIAFHRSAVNPRLYQKHYHPDFLSQCFWADDFWLAYYAFRMDIPRYVVRGQVTDPEAEWIKQLPQPDGSVGTKSGGGGNLANYRICESQIVKNQKDGENCSWCI